MEIERFAMWVFVALGRLLVVVGGLAIVERFFVERSLADAFVTALLYGGGLIGFGTILTKMGRLGLGHHHRGRPRGDLG